MTNLADRLARLSPEKRQLLEQRLRRSAEAAEPIAIVGMSCRLPGAPDLAAYWRLIRDGVCAISEIPASRWDVDALFDPTGEQPGKMSIRSAGLIDGVDRFDPQFFGISPREAAQMDPQQRLLLEVGWEALEVAAIAPETLRGSATGVFVGIGATDYSKIPAQFDDYFERIDAHVGTGNALSLASNRLSYILDLHGPSMSVDTACSSGLLGIHLAVQSLRNRECDAALAGGVNLILSPETTIAFSKARMLSPDGLCRPFDAGANGYVRGEGCGIIVLKRLTDAARDGDRVLAVIRGSAANQDGRTSGVTAPSGRAQQAVIRAALSQAGLTPEKISYLEAHGTGTPLGDPIEVEALGHLFRRRAGAGSATDAKATADLPCYVTSVKANIGHTETVSGVAGIIKVVLMMQHGLIPGQLHLKTLNPRIKLEGTRLEFPRQPIPWEPIGRSRIAGISSFGFGGTNTHLVIEEAQDNEPAVGGKQQAAPESDAVGPATDDREPLVRPRHLLALSARTSEALTTLAARFAEHVEQNAHEALADICYSANAGRSHFTHRAAIIASDRDELHSRLVALLEARREASDKGQGAKKGNRAASRPSPHVKVGRTKPSAVPRVAFLFTGQGAQYPGMGQELYDTQPAFRQALDQCDALLREHLDPPLLDVMFGRRGLGPRLDETGYTQPALFAFEYALAQLWQSWGIEPSMVIGHSIGECVAACIAGVFSLEDGLRLIAARSALMQALPRNGRMAVVFAAESEVREAISEDGDRVDIAAVNGPNNTVISGEADAAQVLLDEFKSRGLETRPLTVSHAFHSSLMEPMLEQFRRVAESIDYRPPRISLASNVTGQLIEAGEIDADYWCRHVRQPVLFNQGIKALHDEQPAAMLEIGPTTSSLSMARRCVEGQAASGEQQVAWLPSMRKGADPWATMLDTLAQLYVLGARVDWRGFDRDYPRQRLMLPTYPFTRERYWFDDGAARVGGGSANRGPVLHPLIGSRVSTALPQHLFEGRISSKQPAYLADHVVQGSTVFPAAGYIEQALATAAAVFGEGNHVVENLSIQQAMFLTEQERRSVEVAVQPENAGTAPIEIYSAAVDRDTEDLDWKTHAVGTIRHGAPSSETTAPIEAPTPAEETAPTEKTAPADDSTCADDRPPRIDVPEIESRVVSRLTFEQFYHELMHSRGLAYGPAFQILHALRRTTHEAIADIRLPESVTAELDRHHLHPALGDALIQLSAGVVPLEDDGSYSPYTYMPMTIGHVRIFERPRAVGSRSLIAHSVRRSDDNRPSPEWVDADCFLADEDGRVLVEIRGVRLRRVGRGLGAEDSADVRRWLYDIEWQRCEERVAEEPSSPAAQPAASASAEGPWLIFADRQGVAERLRNQLAAKGERSVLVHPGKAFESLPADDNRDHANYRLDPLDQQDYERLLTSVFGEGGDGACRGVVHLWSLDIEEHGSGAANTDACFERARRLGCGAVLTMLRRLARFPLKKSPGVWLVTRGAQPIEGQATPSGERGSDSAASQSSPVAVAQSPLWGLGRVAALEMAEFAPRLVDLDPEDDAVSAAAQLEDAITDASASDEQLAFRGGQRLTARLQRRGDLFDPDGETGAEGGMHLPVDRPFRLHLEKAGSFDSLRWTTLRRKAPEPGQVELRVHATGLNFSDVLKGMGLYPGITDDVVPLGIECAGVVTAVGEGVERLQVGDEVMGVVPYSLASHATTAEYALIHKPLHLSDAEAATIPIAFLTAYYALVRLGHLEPGERVLIHAGAGGVGLAAIQIARHIGAEIFSTAGSDRKRDYLRSLGVEHVFNSRTLEFADQILEVTDRQGVDVVLNSLPGEAVTKSLASLRAYGRFLEIGKIDIYQNRMIGLLPFQDNLSYFAIDLDRLLRQRPETVQSLYAELMERFEAGDYQPLMLTEFGAEETADAFRYMAGRKNIGKIVIDTRHGEDEGDGERAGSAGEEAGETAESSPTASLGVPRPDGTYLITGGLGALGLKLSEWLAGCGAKHVAVMSRREPSETARERLDALRQRGVNVYTLQADVSDPKSLGAALEQLSTEAPPLRGVIHAAGVLDDGMLMEMTLDQLDRAMAPKVRGAWNLHALTREMSLDFFVLFSSIASVLGSPGQANYAAGNAFLDSLAARRRREGLPATSINWGPWADAGMTAEGDRAARLEARGMGLLPVDSALELLGRLAPDGPTRLAVVDARWSTMLGQTTGRVPSLLGELASQEGAEAEELDDVAVDQEFRGQLLAADLEQRVTMFRDHFIDELSRIMSLDPDELDVDQPLSEIGMDSLLVMELKNNLEKRLAFNIPMAVFLERPSIATLAAQAARLLVESDTAEDTAGEPRTLIEREGEASDEDRTTGDGKRTAAAHLGKFKPLVRIQAEGDGPPLFCLHPLGGDVSCYADFARHVRGRPVYGVRGRGSRGRFPPHDDMREMVHDYLDAIRKVQPEGPYHLTSWSAGGVFSYELARAFRAEGAEVGLLMLFDTPLPSIYDQVNLDDDVAFLLELGKFANWFAGADIDIDSLSVDELRKVDEDARWEFMLQIAKTHGAVPSETTTERIRCAVGAAKSHACMIRDYTIVPFEQPVHLVRPQQPDVLGQMTGQSLGPDLGWGAAIGDQLRIHTSPGDHFSMMQNDNARRLAELVCEVIEAEVNAPALSPEGEKFTRADEYRS